MAQFKKKDNCKKKRGQRILYISLRDSLKLKSTKGTQSIVNT